MINNILFSVPTWATACSLSVTLRFFPYASVLWSDSLFLFVKSPWFRGETPPVLPFPAIFPFLCTLPEIYKKEIINKQVHK